MDKVKCQICKTVRVEKLCFVMCPFCTYFYCRNCFYERVSKLKKTGNENNSTIVYVCPLCEEVIEKGNLIKIDFNQSVNN